MLAPVRKALSTTAKKTSQHDERDEGAAAQQELRHLRAVSGRASVIVCAPRCHCVTSVVAAGAHRAGRRRGPARDPPRTRRRAPSRSLGRPGTPPTTAPFESTRMRSAMAMTSLSSEETKRIAVALARQAAHDLEDLGLGARRRCRAWARRAAAPWARSGGPWRPRPSAGCRRRASRCWRSGLETRTERSVDHLPRPRCAPCAARGRSGSGSACRLASTMLWATESVGTRPSVLRSSGTSTMPASMRSATLAPSRRSLVEPHLAARLGPDAGEHLHELGAAGAHEPVEAQDLAGTQLERDVVEQEAAAQPRQRHVLDAQERLARRDARSARRARPASGPPSAR